MGGLKEAGDKMESFLSRVAWITDRLTDPEEEMRPHDFMHTHVGVATKEGACVNLRK